MRAVIDRSKTGILYALLLFFLGCGRPEIPDFLQGRIVFLGDSITHNGTYISYIEYELLKQFPDHDFDIYAIGLSSETASGLSEPGHSSQRPCVLDRLDNALKVLKPDIVAACYGMNDGIYHPQSEARFMAYKNGMVELIDKVRAAGAKVILLTPPPFDPKPIQEKLADDSAEVYGYAHPYYRYDSVLADYAKWLQTIHQPEVMSVDFNASMTDYLTSQRTIDPEYTFSKDGVHPDAAGHLIMARTFLNNLGVTTASIDVQIASNAMQTNELYKLVHERRSIRSAAWRKHIGHTHTKKWPALSIEEAEGKASQLYTQIKSITAQKE